MKKIIILGAVTLLGLLAGFSVRAQTVTNVYWDFTAGANPASSSMTGLTASSVSYGNSSSSSLSINDSSPSGSYITAAGFAASGGNNIGITVQTGALDSSSSAYLAFDFSLSPAAGVSYNITDVSLGSRQTGSGPQELSLYASKDGFISDFTFLGSAPVAADSTWAAEDFSGISISLPDDGSTTSFRIYGSDGTGSSSVNWRIDDLAATLTPVAAPEPSTVDLAALGGLAGFFGLRRRV